jgi:hypothetical protein
MCLYLPNIVNLTSIKCKKEADLQPTQKYCCTQKANLVFFLIFSLCYKPTKLFFHKLLFMKFPLVSYLDRISPFFWLGSCNNCNLTRLLSSNNFGHSKKKK